MTIVKRLKATITDLFKIKVRRCQVPSPCQFGKYLVREKEQNQVHQILRTSKLNQYKMNAELKQIFLKYFFCKIYWRLLCMDREQLLPTQPASDNFPSCIVWSPIPVISYFPFPSSREVIVGSFRFLVMSGSPKVTGQLQILQELITSMYDHQF